MRGTHRRTSTMAATPGIIPAYAGNTRGAVNTAEVFWDHPRVCGEHTYSNIEQSWIEGSSPRMRGTQSLSSHPPSLAGDHPRVCGEHCPFNDNALLRAGSSPRMRGTPCKGCCHGYEVGIIPAYAGNTYAGLCGSRRIRDHPRVCGEHWTGEGSNESVTGSSPRMRGTPEYQRKPAIKEGIIPAYAGNTRAR